MTGPIVTVVMTAYNRAAFIGEAIESVLGQTFQDFSVLVVDDASRDQTVQIANAYASRDPRVTVIVNETNRGQFANRNHAASLVTTPLFKFHDSDDLMYPHCLDVMVKALTGVPDADFALSGSRSWPGGPVPMLLTPRLAYEREFLGTGVFQYGPACAMFRTPFFRSLGGFDDHGVASDYLFWFKACRRGRVLLCPSDLFYYRHHPGQELVAERSFRDYARARAMAWSALNAPDCPLEGATLVQAKRNFAFNTARAAWSHLRRGDVRLSGLTLKSAGLSLTDWSRYFRLPQRAIDAGTPR